MKRSCVVTGETFLVSLAEQEYCKINNVPLPTVAPLRRIKGLLSFRNRVHLYRTVCSFSQKRIFSGIPPEKNFNVYDVDVWESDQWSGLDYGVDYDFSRPFFEQIAQLFKRVPIPNLSVVKSTMENCDYANGITSAKNSYLLFAASRCEDCFFSRMVNDSKNMIDCVMCMFSELCYDCRDVMNCYHLKFSEHCHTCSDSYFLYNCHGCSNCYGCTNLMNKQYYFYNEKCSKEEYQRRVAAIDLGSHLVLQNERKKCEEFLQRFPMKFLFGKNNENSTGNFLNNTKNCHSSFFITEGEDLEHCVWVDGGESSFFYCMYGNKAKLMYNSVSCGDNAYNIKFSSECWPGAHDLEYCLYVGYGSSHCFGCVGLKKQSYCVLNKQYSKADYLELVGRIKAHMKSTGEYGQFFPATLSLYPYNKSEAIDFIPLTREEAISQGFQWVDETPEDESPSFTIPDHIDRVSDVILAEQLACTVSGRKYKIIKEELEFYRQQRLPLPRVAPLERVKIKSNVLNLGSLKEDRCGNCHNAILTVFDNSKNNVFCERCFQQVLE